MNQLLTLLEMNNTLLTDPPKFKELSKNDRLYVIYNEVVRHIETLICLER